MFTGKEQMVVKLCLFSLVVTSAMHITFGATYLVYGRTRAQQTGKENAYTNQLPSASYIFITAILMLLYCAIASSNLLSAIGSGGFAVVSWALGWSVVVMNFGVGTITANQYSLLHLLIDYYKIAPAQLPQHFLRQYNCLLADAIMSFAVGLPSSLVLARFENYQRAATTFEALGQPEIELSKKQFRIQENIVEGGADNSESSS